MDNVAGKSNVLASGRVARSGLRVNPSSLSLWAETHAYDEATYLNSLKRCGSCLVSIDS